MDEAQNLLEALRSPDWSFVKTLATIQEENINIRFIIVTSDYFFYEGILRNTPSLDYIETFYLGEMTRRDAAMLYRELAGGEPEPSIIDLIGGKPAHIKEVLSYPDIWEKPAQWLRKSTMHYQQR